MQLGIIYLPPEMFLKARPWQYPILEGAYITPCICMPELHNIQIA
jgi:hypothetical protein